MINSSCTIEKIKNKSVYTFTETLANDRDVKFSVIKSKV